MNDLPELIKRDGIEGYDSKEIDEYMAKRGSQKAWGEFINGSTGAIIDGKFVVYRWDVEKFLDGGVNTD